MESYFQKIPSEELIENKQPEGSDSGADDTTGKDPAEKAGSDKKKDLDQAEKAGKEEE